MKYTCVCPLSIEVLHKLYDQTTTCFSTAYFKHNENIQFSVVIIKTIQDRASLDPAKYYNARMTVRARVQ